MMILGLCALTFGAVAQQREVDEATLRLWRQSHQMRDASQLHLNGQFKQVPALKGEAKRTTGMPNDSWWFPGEWEEVQAIVVTPYYYYRPDSAGFYNMMADPLVPGVAAYYNGYNAQQASAYGPYVGVMDTASAFGQVAFYLMDAIQLGGAQAWVRVEKLEDSTAVLTHLATMGLRTGNIRFLEAPGNSFWFRDCGPICFYYGEGDTVGMLDFEYYPGRALDDSLPVYIERQFGLPNFTTQIEWEGGNCVVDGAGMVLSSDHIYSANRDTHGQLTWDGVDVNSIGYSTKRSLTSAQVKDSLHALIGPRATHILPAFRYDGGTGHVDLYADMLDENLFIFSKMPDAYSNWVDYRTGAKNMDSLCSYKSYFEQNYRRRYIPFPSTDNGGNFSSQQIYNQAYTRTYSNHTFVNNVLIQPCFSAVGSDGMPTAAWDRANIEEVKKAYPGYTIYCIDVRSFDGSGGAIHCITKQIPAEHPIRILHHALHDNTGTDYVSNGAPIMARITNVDGIASASLVYRVNGGQWQTLTMEPDQADNYAAVIPTSSLYHGDYVTIEYYISATSNAGKTITKPMTASQGGFYTFYLGENPNVGIAAVEPEERFGQFYPNPAESEAHLQVEMGEGGRYEVTFLDLGGRTVHSTSLEANGSILFTVNTSLLPSGVYHVVFAGNGERVVRRLVVK